MPTAIRGQRPAAEGRGDHQGGLAKSRCFVQRLSEWPRLDAESHLILVDRLAARLPGSLGFDLTGH